jgi:translation initiation factor 4E
MSRGPSKEGYIKGYKDVPSLAAIRERVSFSKASNSPTTPSTSTPPLTAAGVFDTKEIAKPVATGEKPVVKPVDVMSTPVKEETVVVIQDASPQESSSSGSDDGLVGKRKEHPLQHAW